MGKQYLESLVFVENFKNVGSFILLEEGISDVVKVRWTRASQIICDESPALRKILIHYVMILRKTMKMSC